MRGLILEPTGQRAGEYKRAGRFGAALKDLPEAHRQYGGAGKVQDICPRREDILESQDYEEYDPATGYCAYRIV
jgi:hypothetical protein